MLFKDLGLQAELLQAIEAHGYTVPTPIQTKAIPAILKQKDILAGAQTGTGKTAAFALPVVQLLSSNTRRGKNVRALVLTPTRELAAQVNGEVLRFSRSLSLQSRVVFGGVNIKPQIKALREGTDILVATPGRLLDHMTRKTVDLSHVDILILDEADRMLDMGFIHDIRRVIRALPRTRQNLLFSATYSDAIRKLAGGMLVNPISIEITSRNTAAASVLQKVHHVEKGNKRATLSHLIKSRDWEQTLVFTRTKHGANRLVKQLTADGVHAAAIHGNKSQAARTRALSDFKSGRLRTLVATDIAARGLDIDQLPQVVNYELPQVAEDYVHRIGRTGRAGHTGFAISLVCRDEERQLKRIERLLKRAIDEERITLPRNAADRRVSKGKGLIR
ncbi:MAG: ATP-dependent RNA helicase RhlE [Deltaproteobacteria bacterium]|nr:MAG: ATP-dependent RNA helicase RhlE [Deltaproteobacteria bacterium]